MARRVNLVVLLKEIHVDIIIKIQISVTSFVITLLL